MMAAVLRVGGVISRRVALVITLASAWRVVAASMTHRLYPGLKRRAVKIVNGELQVTEGEDFAERCRVLKKAMVC